MKRGLEGGRGKQAFVVSGKRSRYEDEDDSDSSQEPLEGSSSTKSFEELKAVRWKLCEPAPVTVDGDGSIAVNGSTVYMSSRYSNTLYEFNSDKRAWVSSIKCDRKSFGLAVVNGDLTLVGGRSLDDSILGTLTSIVKNRSGIRWIQKYPPMCESKENPCCCSNEHLLVVGARSCANTLEIMDTNKLKWKNVNFPNNYGVISSMTILGDRIYVLTHKHCLFNSYCTISACSLSVLLLGAQSSSINQPLIWHKVHPLCDLHRPCLTNFSGNLVAVGGKITVNTYSDVDGRDCKQYSVSPELYVYSDKVNSVGSGGWNFVANLPTKSGYPNSDFLVATIQGHQLVICGGNHTEVEHSTFTNADNDVSFSGTDIVHMGLLN